MFDWSEFCLQNYFARSLVGCSVVSISYSILTRGFLGFFLSVDFLGSLTNLPPVVSLVFAVMSAGAS